MHAHGFGDMFPKLTPQKRHLAGDWPLRGPRQYTYIRDSLGLQGQTRGVKPPSHRAASRPSKPRESQKPRRPKSRQKLRNQKLRRISSDKTAVWHQSTIPVPEVERHALGTICARARFCVKEVSMHKPAICNGLKQRDDVQRMRGNRWDRRGLGMIR